MYKYLILLIFLAGCGSNNSSTPSMQDANSTNYYYTNLNGGDVDNLDDQILQCLESNGTKTGLCETVCASEAFPGIIRYDAWLSSFSKDNSCSYYLFQSGSMTNYWFYWDKSYACSNAQLMDNGLYLFDSNRSLNLYDLNSNLKTQYTLYGSGGLQFLQIENWTEYHAWITCKKYDELLKDIDKELKQ